MTEMHLEINDQSTSPKEDLCRIPRILVRESSWKEAGMSFDDKVASVQALNPNQDLESQFERFDILLFLEDPSGMVQQYGPEVRQYGDLLRAAIRKGLFVVYDGVSTDDRAAIVELFPDIADKIHCKQGSFGFDNTVIATARLYQEHLGANLGGVALPGVPKEQI